MKATLLTDKKAFNRRRYYLHKKLRSFGFRVKTNEHTVYITEESFEIADDQIHQWLGELRFRFKYNLQFEIE